MGRIVHFGLGNFARAHLLDYTQDAGEWDVIGISLRSPDIRDGLRKQGFDYDLCIHGVGPKRIHVLQDVLVGPEDPQKVLDAMSDADIISITVTEKGYHLAPSGQLDLNDPAIIADLANPFPATVIGYLAKDLAQRTRPVTVLSCDNREENGNVLRAAVAEFACTKGIEIDWNQATFPNSMVDRITPATTEALRKASGDPMAVPTEPFREWVIEDAFAGPRPNWPGVQFVSDVTPHELRKLRMLNGAHSFLAYAGLARGHTFVHEAVNDPVLREQVQDLMKQAGATLPAAVQAQVPAYARALINRFENPEIQHRLLQIAMDGSQKVPVRLLGTLRDSSGPVASITQGIKAWIDFCINQTKRGIPLDDPMASDIAACAMSADPMHALLTAIGGADVIPLLTSADHPQDKPE